MVFWVLIFNLLTTNCKIADNSESTIIDDQKEKLIGKWENQSNSSKFVLEFYKNGTWKRTFDYGDKIEIKKGKYVLGNEGEVFIRPFGPQHFRNNDTINDLKTSLGIYLYYLYDTILVNNQEDYKNIYLKTSK